MQRAKDLMFAIKTDAFVQQTPKPPVQMSQWIANAVHDDLRSLPFAHFFRSDTVLVPVPRSSLMQPGTLWVPDRIATAMAATSVGGECVRYLTRAQPLRKAAFSDPSDRPLPAEQFETLAVQGRISEPPPSQVVLVDDIITRGSTLLGAANRIVESFPAAQIRGFAAMRTATPAQFSDVFDPRVGTIQYRELVGDTIRKP